MSKEMQIKQKGRSPKSDDGNLGSQLLQPGVSSSARLCFALLKVNEC